MRYIPFDSWKKKKISCFNVSSFLFPDGKQQGCTRNFRKILENATFDKSTSKIRLSIMDTPPLFITKFPIFD